MIEEEEPQSTNESSPQEADQNQSTGSFDHEPEIKDVESSEQTESQQSQAPPEPSSETSTSGEEANSSLSIDSEITILASFTGVVMLPIGWIFGKLSG